MSAAILRQQNREFDEKSSAKDIKSFFQTIYSRTLEKIIHEHSVADG